MYCPWSKAWRSIFQANLQITKLVRSNVNVQPFYKVFLVGDLPLSNKTTRFSFQSSTNALHKSALLNLPLQFAVVSIEEFSLWHLITSKSRSSFEQPELADEWLQDKKNIHSEFLSFQKPKKIAILLLSYLSITAWRDSDK